MKSFVVYDSEGKILRYGRIVRTAMYHCKLVKVSLSWKAQQMTPNDRQWRGRDPNQSQPMPRKTLRALKLLRDQTLNSCVVRLDSSP